MRDASGTAGRWVNASVIGPEAARATWALAARERLLEVATEYHATISYKELADFVQERSLVRTQQLHMHWIGDVLTRVSLACIENGEPLLSSLCVDSRGRVGAGYTVVVEDHRREALAHPDEHAAKERLACYRFFGAELPEGGGVPAMPVVAQPTRSRAPSSSGTSRRRTTAGATGSASATATAGPATRSAGSATRSAGSATRSAGSTSRAAAAAPAALVTCPVHFTVLPANGVCDLCD